VHLVAANDLKELGGDHDRLRDRHGALGASHARASDRLLTRRYDVQVASDHHSRRRDRLPGAAKFNVS
jgi:hypothetical protein